MPLQIRAMLSDRGLLGRRLGEIGLVLFAFATFYGRAQANQALLILLLALLVGNVLDARKLLRDPLFVTSSLFVGYTFLRAAFAIASHPEQAAAILDASTGWAMLAMLPAIMVAAFVYGGRLQPHHLLAVAVAGFLGRVIRHIDWTAGFAFFAKFFAEEHARATFGFSMIALALWSLILILGLIIFSDDYLRAKSRGERIIRLLLLLAAIYLLAFLVVISKTRSVWVLSAVFIPLCLIWKLAFFSRQQRKKSLLIVGLVLLIPAFFIFENRGVIQDRLSHERQVIVNIVEGSAEQVPATSIGVRFHMYKVFLEEAGARPVVGWGPRLSKQLLEKSPYPGMKYVSHFHNLFVEIYLQLGLIGLGLYGAMFAVLLHTALTTGRNFYPSGNVLWFLLTSIAVFWLISLIDHTLWSSPTRYFFGLLGGIAYAPKAANYIRRRSTTGASRGPA